ncbi:MAG: GTP-binding protein [Promethearchaeota archaeon]
MAEEYDYLFKSIVVGDGGVGKTALTLRFSKGFFTEDYKMTIGVDFHVKTITIDSNEGPIRSKLQIWDTGGQERFSSIRPMYYRGSLGALLIFDLTNSSSFEHLPGWIEEVRTNVKTEIPLLLVGNKSDLVEQRAISLEEINEFTYNFNLFYMETSAKTGEGVGDCFYILACLMIGSGVPDQLISSGVVFNPGQISSVTTEEYVPTSPQVKPDFEFSAPPVPEPEFEKQESAFSFEPEPEFEFEAPPVPEPVHIEQPDTGSTYDSDFEPEIPIPEPQKEIVETRPTDFEFKTPEEILAEDKSGDEGGIDFMSFPTPPTSTTQETYKPKTVPFTSSIPVPAPTPDGFQTSQETASPLNSVSSSPLFTSSEPPREQSDSLADYMPEAISKKDKKKLEKQKKKEEKEKKIQDEKERQQKLLEEIKKAKKEKKEKSKKEKKEKAKKEQETLPSAPIQPTRTSEPASTPSLFQTLAQKGEDAPSAASSAFIPFSKTEEAQVQESSKLRIIPNAADIDTKPSGVTPLQSVSTPQKESSKSSGKELIICKNCGAILSSDYAFCNKCGTEL